MDCFSRVREITLEVSLVAALISYMSPWHCACYSGKIPYFHLILFNVIFTSCQMVSRVVMSRRLKSSARLWLFVICPKIQEHCFLDDFYWIIDSLCWIIDHLTAWWMDRGECRLISDACVSMRVCFDTFCFSSTQQRLADEEDASQLANSNSTTVIHPDQGGALAGTTAQGILAPQHQQTVATMGTLRELQELLRVKDERIADLEEQLRRRDSEIQDLRSHLDKFLSVLPFKSPITPTKPRPRKQRAQGISAEPPLQVLAPLVVVDKSDRLVPRDFFPPFFFFSFTEHCYF